MVRPQPSGMTLGDVTAAAGAESLQALDITADRIMAYGDARRAQDHVTPATVNRELGALRRMFSLARRRSPRM